jgi:hypothetical protein
MLQLQQQLPWLLLRLQPIVYPVLPPLPPQGYC